MKHLIRKGLSWLGVIALLLTMLPTGMLLVAAAEKTGFDLPEGYTLSPVSTVEDLKAIKTGSEALNIYYYLTENITIDTAEWRPLGNHETTNAFWDILDGNGYAITFAGTDGFGVKITGSWDGGLFFAMNGEATVKNLTTTGSITSSCKSTGAIVGQMMSGTIDRCVNRVTIVSTGDQYTGGLAGRVANGLVSNCLNYGSVTGKQMVGGLVGAASYNQDMTADETEAGIIKLCIANCANFGSVTGSQKVGGVLGLADKNKTFRIQNSYNAGTVDATGVEKWMGAIVCSNWPAAVNTAQCYALTNSCAKNLTTTVIRNENEMKTQAFADTLNANATGITYQEALDGDTKSVATVAWQIGDSGYPVIPMVEPITPAKDLTEEEQMEVIRQKLIAYFLEQDTFDDGATAGICYTSKAGEYLASQQADGHWDDVDYYCTASAANGAVWEPYLALDRMQAMAMAYANPHGPWYHDKAMLQGVENAFTYWASIRDANPDKDDYEGPWSTNWWENGNGVQLRFSRIGVVLKDVLSADAIGIILRKLDVNGSTGSGQNALWQTQNALYRALVAEDAVQFKKVVNTNLAVNLRVGGLNDEAVQVDNSFHAHGDELYTNGYGRYLWRDMSFWIDTLAGTDFAMPQSVVDLMADYMLGGTRWMIRGNLLEIANGYTGGSAASYIVPLQRMIKNDPQNAAEYQKVLDSITGDSGTTYNGADGNHYMWTSDLMAHMRQGYGVNVRTNDKLMKSAEWRATWPDDATDTGNLIFWTADATASVMIDGDEYLSVYPTYDWRHIPGTTAPFALATHYGFDNGSNDTWGVSNSRYGAVAYTFNKHDGTNKRTQGKIGYFFFDDEYVSLGAGISSNHEQAIHTTVNQTKSGGDVTVDGAVVADGTDNAAFAAHYVYNNCIGYVFPDETPVHVSNLNQYDKNYPYVWGTGYAQDGTDANRKDNGVGTFSLWIDHGVKPASASYAYIVVPGKTQAEVAAYSQSNPITIVANTDKVQAVRHEGLKQTQINFYEAGKLEYAPGKTVSVDGACSLIIDESGSEPVISEAVSNTKSAQSVTVALTMGENTTTTRFCSLEEPYAGKTITLAAGGNSLIQSSPTTAEHSSVRAFDKNLETYWESREEHPWISYDLQESLYVGDMIIRWGDQYAKAYELQYSENGVDWTTAYTQTNGQGGMEVVPYNTIGRYWRLLCTESSGNTYQIKEISFQTSGNVALNKPVEVSYTYTADMPASYMVDGDFSTRWAGERSRDNNWVVVDLGLNTRLDAVRVLWENAYSSEYTIDVSEDGSNWNTVRSVNGQKGWVQTALPEGTTGRYLRVQGVKAALKQYGMSIYELEIYGELQIDSENVAAGKTAVAGDNTSTDKVTDQNTDTVWQASKADSLTIDLGENHQLDSVFVTWGDTPAAAYHWEVSFDGQSFSGALPSQAGCAGTQASVMAANARYLRLVLEGSGDVAEIGAYGAPLADMHPDKAALKKAIDVYVREDVYTPESYAAYQQALAVATNVYASAKVTQKQVDDTLADLQTAYNALDFRDFGEVLATLPGSTQEMLEKGNYFYYNWKALSQKLDLSKEDLSKIYLFATIDVARDPDKVENTMFSNGRIQLRSPHTDGVENKVYVNTNTMVTQLGRNVIYFPLSDMLPGSGTMDWSQVETFMMYIDSFNKVTGQGSLTAALSDIQIIRTNEPTKVKVACVGDSITAGVGSSSPSQSYVSQLQTLLGDNYEVKNFGHSGRTLLAEGTNGASDPKAGYTSSSLFTASKAYNPDVVTIMLGTNDSKPDNWKTPLKEKYEQELRDLIQVYRDLPSHPTVILATSPTVYKVNWGINDPVLTGEIVPLQRKVAAEMSCPLIDINVGTKNLDGNTLFPDGVHPSDAGHKLLANLFAQGIRDAGARLYAFTLNGRDATINEETREVTVTLPYDTTLTALTPTVQLMAGATISPAGATDFTAPVRYTVTAPDQTTIRDYVVTVAREEPVHARGDVNNDTRIDVVDALMALQTAAGKIELTPAQAQAANVDGTGKVTAYDALLILQYATHYITAFPDRQDEELLSLISYIDPRIGVESSSNTVIGPQRPNASVNPSPDGPGYAANGYSKGDIRGFSQMHVSGTGVAKYGQVLLSPQVGLSTRLDGHDSAKTDEQATCSEYSVNLSQWDIDCSFTCTENASIYKFRYPQSNEASLLIDMAHNNGDNNNKGHNNGGLYNTSSDIRIEIGTDDLGQTVLSGGGYYKGGWGQPHNVYFYAVVDKAPTATGTYDASGAHPGVNKLGPATITSEEQRMAGLGAYLQFDTRPDEEITVKVGMSFKSVEQAKHYLDDEIPAWDYDGIKTQTERLWNRELNRMVVDGGMTEEQKTIFYTAMYHAMIMPRYRTGDIAEYGDAVMLDDHFAGWDTFRTLMPLHTLIRPDLMADIVNSFITRYQENGYVRDSMTGGHDMYEQQGGDNVDVIIADAYLKLKDDPTCDVDWNAAYEVVKNHADNYRLSWKGKGANSDFAENVIPDPYSSYKTLGYIPGDDPLEKIMCCNYTLDYAYNDFCAAQMAKDLGTQADYEKYLARSGNWQNLWNPDLTYGDYTGFIGPRKQNGEFIDIDVTKNGGSWKEYFYEANAYNYSFYVPQDPEKLIELCGGEDAFCDRLYNGIFKGQVDFGNEPAFLSAFLFAYTSQPYLTADCVDKVRSRYSLRGNGGNDDSGALSSWYIFTTMGLFPCAGQDFYFLTSPHAENTTIHLENGKTITIKAPNLSAKNKYIQSITLNGEAYNSTTIPHSLLANGAEIVFEMGEKKVDYAHPAEWRTVTFDAAGGTTVPVQYIADGKPMTKPADPVRKGYDFAGWYTDAKHTSLWNFETDTVTRDMTLYAKWTESVVQNNGTVSLTTEKVENLSKITLGEGACIDWAFFGYKQAVKKSGGNPVFSGNVSAVSGELTQEDMKTYNGNTSPYFSWNDGTPTATAADVRSIIWNDIGLIVPVDLSAGKHEVSLYVSGVRSGAYIEVLDKDGNALLREDLPWQRSTTRAYYKTTLAFDTDEDGTYQIRLMVDQGNRDNANYSVSLFAASAT